MNITYKAKEHTHTISEEDMDDLIRSEDNKSTDEEIKFEEKKNVSNDEVSSRKPAIVDIFKGLFGIAFGVIVIILVIAICTGKLDTLAYKHGLAGKPDSMKGVATDTESDREYTTVDSEEKATDLRGEVESTSHPNGKDEEDEKESSEEHIKKDSFDFIEQYRKTIDSYEAKHYSNGDNPSYNLIWFDNDDTPELNPPKMLALEDAVFLTTVDGLYGAIAILYDGALKEVSNFLQTPHFHILPISEHGVLCTNSLTLERKKNLMMNESAPLTKSVYEYSAGIVSMIP